MRGGATREHTGGCGRAYMRDIPLKRLFLALDGVFGAKSIEYPTEAKKIDYGANLGVIWAGLVLSRFLI